MSCYFIELYLDNLRDLMFAMENPRGNPPKLEIKLDVNKMVVVKNVVVKVGAIGLDTTPDWAYTTARVYHFFCEASRLRRSTLNFLRNMILKNICETRLGYEYYCANGSPTIYT